MMLNLRGVLSIIVILFVSTILPQTNKKGIITGRVVTEEGTVMTNVTVTLSQAGVANGSSSTGSATLTDDDGKFRFENLAPRLYAINVAQAKEYVMLPNENGSPRYYRIGDNPVITMIKGGIITGRVTGARKEPIIGIRVTPVKVKDSDGRSVFTVISGRAKNTDDRGIYRLYGLGPGTYIVYASRSSSTARSPYSMPTTFHPSSSRDTASRIDVAAAAEVTNIDIEFGQIRTGYTIAGTLITDKGLSSIVKDNTISLYDATTGDFVASTNFNPAEYGHNFTFSDIHNGEYRLSALMGNRSATNDGAAAISEPRRIAVRGSDVTGIELKLTPTASIAGRVILEATSQNCDRNNISSTQEFLITAQRTNMEAGIPITVSSNGAVNEKGEFLLRNLVSGRYRINPLLVDENSYVKSIMVSGKISSSMYDISQGELFVKPGDAITGLTVTISGGASSLMGTVVSKKKGDSLPSRLRVYLVPRISGPTDNYLLYAETLTSKDGKFSFKNRAPGRYWVLVQSIHEADIPENSQMPTLWDINDRAKLRKEAEANEVEVELKPCQRLTNQIMMY